MSTEVIGYYFLILSFDNGRGVAERKRLKRKERSCDLFLTSFYFLRSVLNTNSKKCVEFRFSVSPLSSVVEQPPCKR